MKRVETLLDDSLLSDFAYLCKIEEISIRKKIKNLIVKYVLKNSVEKKIMKSS